MKMRSRSLRGQLFTMMAVIAIVECVVLVLTVALSGVFTELDAEAFRFFENDSAERVVSLDSNTGRLIRNTVSLVNTISDEAQELAAATGVNLAQAYLDNDLYNQLAAQSTEELLEFLNSNSVSAAFFILNGSSTHPDDPNAHSAVYIRDSAPGVTDSDRRSLQLEVGPLAVARDYTIAASNRWELDMTIDSQDAAYYTSPITAAIDLPRSELVRYGYWSPPVVIIPGNQECVSYTMPVLDAAGTPYGVIGFEISLSYFTKEYFSNTNLPYQGSFFAITSGSSREDMLNTAWIIPGSPTASAHLHSGQVIPVRQVESTGVYETSLEGLGNMYCTVNELTMYSKNSPFVDQQWLLVGMVEQSVLNESSTRIGTMLLTNMAITLGVSFIAIFLLTFVSSRKIVGLSQYINDLSPGSDIQFVRTDLREIDDLTSAIERLNRRINDSLKVTSKMMELTQLPLGGYEISDDLDTVMLTEYIYSLLHLKQGEPVSKSDWKQMFAELTAHPADGYTDVYRYDSANMHALHYGNVLRATENLLLGESDGTETEALYQYSQVPEERQKWLRIIEAPTDNGSVGMILDATSDIDECMRLAHELDYDALTRLYNRTAFKREAFKKITENPNKVGAMIFSDLDNLKRINDTYGHLMGDKLITTAADMFREFVEYGGIVARISGDEFAIFLYGYDTKDEILQIISKLYRGFKKRHFETPDGETQWISCSSGIAWYPEDSTDVADLLKLSDYAMYEAKHSKKGTVYEKNGTFLEFSEDSSMENEQTQNNGSKDELTRLIDDKLFKFLFQPIVDLHTAEIYGYEAFMKPQVEGYQTPGEVLSAARAASLLGPLESALVLKIFEVTQARLGAIGDRKIFVNSIPGQKLSDREWDIVRKEFKDILPHIIMEVTEEENNDLDTMLSKLRKLRRMGIPVAIDDFGQGYSNEVRIIAMQPAIIKIDLELIRNLHADEHKQELVSELVAFAHAQGVKVAAEGVELEQELETVSRFGMDYAQGYLLGRPNFEFKALSESVQQMLDDLKDEDPED